MIACALPERMKRRAADKPEVECQRMEEGMARFSNADTSQAAE